MVTRLIWSNESDPSDLPAERSRSSDDVGASGLDWRAMRAGTKAPDFRLPDTDGKQVSLSGFNLLHAQHIEFLEDGTTTAIPRSVLTQMRVRF